MAAETKWRTKDQIATFRSGFAGRYRKAHFLGIDMTQASLEVADQLARKHGIQNIIFKRRDILSLDLQERFDFIVSTGVVHHK